MPKTKNFKGSEEKRARDRRYKKTQLDKEKAKKLEKAAAELQKLNRTRELGRIRQRRYRENLKKRTMASSTGGTPPFWNPSGQNGK